MHEYTVGSCDTSGMLQQRLTEIKHPDHTLITYPNLGHFFYLSSQWLTSGGPIQPYALADIYAWLEAHSGLSHSYVTTTTSSTIGTNTSSSTEQGGRIMVSHRPDDLS